jgi:hypothetical protein
MRQLLHAGCVVLILIACNHQSGCKNNTSFRNLTASGDSLLFQKTNSLTKELGLSSLVNGVDSFELRIWHGLALATPYSLIDLKYEASGWKLSQTDYWYHWKTENGRLKYPVIDSFNSRSLLLPTNIPALIDSIYSTRLDTLPSQIEIPNFEYKIADGVFYTIELSTTRYYKLLHYNNPDR